jgi:FkbM family methyltransferase
MNNIKAKVAKLIAQTPIQYLPVRVQGGLAKGAHWTLFPHSAYWRMGGHEPEVEAAICQYGSTPGNVCWDLGTHFGIYTVGMAMAVGSSGQVVGFEPDPVSFRRCQHHVERNALSWVKLYNAAVSETENTVNLILSEGAGASTSHLAYESEDASKAHLTVNVATVVLDRLVERNEIRPPQFIKIDVEGHGAKALTGAQQTISRFHPVIVMSFHSAWEVEQTRALLEPMGYRSLTCKGMPIEWMDSNFRGTSLFRC